MKTKISYDLAWDSVGADAQSTYVARDVANGCAWCLPYAFATQDGQLIPSRIITCKKD